jgi:hypothetical protein
VFSPTRGSPAGAGRRSGPWLGFRGKGEQVVEHCRQDGNGGAIDDWSADCPAFSIPDFGREGCSYLHHVIVFRDHAFEFRGRDRSPVRRRDGRWTLRLPKLSAPRGRARGSADVRFAAALRTQLGHRAMSESAKNRYPMLVNSRPTSAFTMPARRARPWPPSDRVCRSLR